MKPSSRQRPSAPAFSLVEVALALGIASFCLIVVLGLVPIGISTGQLASDQTVACSILTHVLADLRTIPTTVAAGATPTSLQYHLPLPQTTAATDPTVLYFGGSAQQFSVAPGVSTSRYRLTVTFLPTTSGKQATQASLLVTWPAQADPNNRSTGAPVGRVQTFAALDRN